MPYSSAGLRSAAERLPCSHPRNFLFARKHVASFVAQLAHDLITRLGEPGHAMRRAAVLFLVSAFAAPVEDGGAALFPVAHGVPVAGFVGAQALIGTEAGVAPKLGDQ